MRTALGIMKQSVPNAVTVGNMNATTGPIGGNAGDEPSDATLSCREVRKVYTRRERQLRFWQRGDATGPEVVALDGVSFDVSPGELVGVAGPSGSGKTTLLHVLAGLVEPTQGTVTFDGTEVGSLSDRDRTRYRLRHIGLVFQRFHLLEALSARENVTVPLIELGVPREERRDRADAVLARVGLADRREHKPAALSGGERQRVAIARALVTNPTIVLADEPTGELDTATGDRVLETFMEVTTDRAVVLASHDQDALAVTDRGIELTDGQISGEWTGRYGGP